MGPAPTNGTPTGGTGARRRAEATEAARPPRPCSGTGHHAWPRLACLFVTVGTTPDSGPLMLTTGLPLMHGAAREAASATVGSAAPGFASGLLICTEIRKLQVTALEIAS